MNTGKPHQTGNMLGLSRALRDRTDQWDQWEMHGDVPF